MGYWYCNHIYIYIYNGIYLCMVAKSCTSYGTSWDDGIYAIGDSIGIYPGVNIEKALENPWGILRKNINSS